MKLQDWIREVFVTDIDSVLVDFRFSYLARIHNVCIARGVLKFLKRK